MVEEGMVVEQTGTPPAQPGEPCQRCGQAFSWVEGSRNLTATEVALRMERDVQLCCIRHPNPLCGRCRRVVHFDDRRKDDR